MDRKLRSTIDKLGEAVSKVITIPYYGKKIASSFRFYGIEVKYFTDQRYDAFLFWDYTNDRPVIAVNALKFNLRRNFSMAHELGHLIINYGWSPLDDSYKAPKNKVLSTEYRGASYSSKQLKNEHIVDEFAAGYLMPTYLLKKFISKEQDQDRSYLDMINDMVHVFKVSRPAAQKRLDHYTDTLKD